MLFVGTSYPSNYFPLNLGSQWDYSYEHYWFSCNCPELDCHKTDFGAYTRKVIVHTSDSITIENITLLDSAYRFIYTSNGDPVSYTWTRIDDTVRYTPALVETTYSVYKDSANMYYCKVFGLGDINEIPHTLSIGDSFSNRDWTTYHVFGSEDYTVSNRTVPTVRIFWYYYTTLDSAETYQLGDNIGLTLFSLNGRYPLENGIPEDGNHYDLRLINYSTPDSNAIQSSHVNIGTECSIQAAPNPFNPSTTISYSTGNQAKGTIAIFSSNGRLVDSKQITGKGTFVWSAGDNPSGVYICNLKANKKMLSTKLIFLR
ncbi:MAG: hypothetical protein A2268_12015 [Candidatus Raymondbacteria bacterium RifOxyA12_full_50_37]|nr:MAG: hypothetical protein A2268_12015 [Candidatus Raymondbacteria bacterium RifOxyA12_full_50_37]OGJ98352.1 MAG: hypothetical protein A2350_11375 [Candidatus Raymondbacteria bacterium RifOxyB12_full_50_8]OGK04849.1 MAG: hypothetical protein A2487_03525 [Candidatus Raymondbacteria bacterium RifOxyC12_full_50_8]